MKYLCFQDWLQAPVLHTRLGSRLAQRLGLFILQIAKLVVISVKYFIVM
jgi:hypothetical protein